MNNKQRAKLDSYNRVADFNAKYAVDLATISEYAAEKTAFDGALVIINNAAGAQVVKSGTSNDAITAAKSTMAKITIKYATRASVKANKPVILFLPTSLMSLKPIFSLRQKYWPLKEPKICAMY